MYVDVGMYGVVWGRGEGVILMWMGLGDVSNLSENWGV